VQRVGAAPAAHNKAELNRILQVVTGFSGAYEAQVYQLLSIAKVSRLHHIHLLSPVLGGNRYLSTLAHF